MRQVYAVLAVRLVFGYEVELALSMLPRVKLTPSVDRSSLKPASFVELSVQARLMRLDDTVAAVRFVGAAGAGCVVAGAAFEYAEGVGGPAGGTRYL